MASRGGARPASLDTRRGSASPRRGGPSARGIGARLATRLPAGRDRPPTRHRRYCRGPRPRRHRTRLADARRGRPRRIPHPASRLPLVVVDGLGEGYGHPTPEGEAAERLASEHGLTLDPTYGAKAFAFLLQRGTCNVQRVVFWHTFAVPVPQPERAP